MRFGSSERQSRQERFSDLLMSATRREQHRRALPPATLDFAFVPALACECRTRREHPPTGYPTTACISFFWTTARARVQNNDRSYGGGGASRHRRL